jgi:hypothetical protein
MDPEQHQAPLHEANENSSEKSIPEPVDPNILQKVAEIHDACERRDVALLRSHAESTGGLINDELRQRACTCPSGAMLSLC